MDDSHMSLKIRLPYQVWADKKGVTRIVAETRRGSLGILPHRLDCVAALEAGILTYENEDEGEVFIAVDEGILVKTGTEVMVSVRHASGGTSLEKLREAVELEFAENDEREQNVRSVLKKLETSFINRIVGYYHGK
ncbi:MAG: F0F1 ATP synthase subunit epsilon [Syntrophomonadaceae bacterium]